MAFYSSEEIRKHNADYNIIYGKRSNGKTYDALAHAIEDFAKHGQISAYIRRWPDEITPKILSGLFSNHGDIIKRCTLGEWEDVFYQAGRFRFCRYEEDEKGNIKIIKDKPFMYSFALAQAEMYKSSQWDNIKTIYFDEFMTRGRYVNGDQEFVKFQNLLSTIIRNRDDVKIFMMANTVDKTGNPYSKNIGFSLDQEQGTIRDYEIKSKDGKTCKIAVEYCDAESGSSKTDSSKYFAFDNPALEMITKGTFEVEEHPILPESCSFKKEDICFEFFCKSDGKVLHFETVESDGGVFLFCHAKTSPIKNEDEDLVFCMDEFDSRPNHIRNMFKPPINVPVCGKILELINQERLFFADNESGEIFVQDYVKKCHGEK